MGQLNWENDVAPKAGIPGSGTYGPKCSICGDLEPFHVHDGDNRLDDYFTIGRGMGELTAARLWKKRAIEAESKLRNISGVLGGQA